MITEKFNSKQEISNVTGAVDDCHVKIKRPEKHDEEPGSLHDARLLRKAAVFTKVEDAKFFKDKFLLGDSAYPSLRSLVSYSKIMVS
ncbi:hypothetical protein NQ314_015540 [Rhamnusium bicolor]|uniref:DDE Tnp4 domain-containing protein n=1 Tax=Rhamnusium bicolor TaxID=1586634 RepID=A0AAV8WYN1_9CUCU|nr:hypothetical protein NQ314_015540 [Rhamnusium bicolor]